MTPMPGRDDEGKHDQDDEAAHVAVLVHDGWWLLLTLALILPLLRAV